MENVSSGVSMEQSACLYTGYQHTLKLTVSLVKHLILLMAHNDIVHLFKATFTLQHFCFVFSQF